MLGASARVRVATACARMFRPVSYAMRIGTPKPAWKYMLQKTLPQHRRNYIAGLGGMAQQHMSRMAAHHLTLNDEDSLNLRLPSDFVIDEKVFDEIPNDIDPWNVVKQDLDSLSGSIKELIGSDHPVLAKVAAHFFSVEGKQVRPALVLLMSRATSLVHTDQNTILPSQRRLAEIIEMIHTASLLHDDVIDVASTRRGAASVNTVFGNKLAVLAGDFLLARASVALARLRHVEVIEIISTVIEHLVKGEVMQMIAADASEHMDNYLKKTFYKTASLMANSLKCSALLGNQSAEIAEIAYQYGLNLGMAYQLVDDVLDCTGTDKTLGKPAVNDIRQGISTMPVLFAIEEFPELEQMMLRKFSSEGDVDKAINLVLRSKGIERTRTLARAHVQRAIEMVNALPNGDERMALVSIARKVLTRLY